MSLNDYNPYLNDVPNDIGKPFIGRDGDEYVEVGQWNEEAGEFDYVSIPTSAFPEEE